MSFRTVFDVNGEPTRAIMMDSQGFLWVGSLFHGAVRFDGKITRNLYAEGLLSDRLAAQIFEDSHGYIWIGTGNGLNRYDPRTNQTRYFFESDGLAGNVFNVSAATIVEDESGQIWFGTTSGLSCFDPETKMFTNFFSNPDDDSTIAANAVYSVALDGKGGVWLAHLDQGLTRLDITTGKAERFGPGSRFDVSEGILAIGIAPSGFIWLGTSRDGLMRLDPESGAVRRYGASDSADVPFPDITVAVIRFLDTGELVLAEGTDHAGLTIFDPKTETYRTLVNDPADRYSLAENNTHGGYQDPDGRFWVVLKNGQIQLHTSEVLLPRLFRYDPQSDNSIASNSPLALYEDSRGEIWFGNFGNGVSRYDPQTEQFTHYPHDPDDDTTIPHNYPTSFLELPDGTFLVAVRNGGIFVFNRETGKIERTMLATDTTSETPVYTAYSMQLDPSNPEILWLAGWLQGVCRFHIQTEALQCWNKNTKPNALNHETILKFIFDRDNPSVLWLPSWGGGLHRLHGRTGKIDVFQKDPHNPASLPSNTVYDALEDKKGRFWAATAAGFGLFDKRTGAFTLMSSETGLTATLIHFINEDKSGLLWLGTEQGLISFDPEARYVRSVLTEEQGLHSRAFFTISSLLTRDGGFWIGGFNGAHYIDLESWGVLSKSPTLYLRRVLQEGQPMVLPLAAEYTKAITLPANNRNFTIEFGTRYFSNAVNFHSEYRLDGLETGWTRANENRSAAYKNLPPGSYQLIIRTVGANEELLGETLTIDVTVQTPWYQTSFARILGILGVLLIGLAIIGWRTLILRQRNEELEVLVHERTADLDRERDRAIILKDGAESANRSKTRFLANASHELRTPLNVVLGHAQLLKIKSGTDSMVSEHADGIYRSSRHLLKLINELIDISAMEKDEVTLLPEEFALAGFFDDLRSYLRSQQNDAVALSLEIGALHSKRVVCDQGKLFQIARNLIDNAIKYTAGGSIIVSGEYDATEERLNISVTDTGAGIDHEDLEKIFERFYRTEAGADTAGGLGIGLNIAFTYASAMGGNIDVESELGWGSCFAFNISAPQAEDRLGSIVADESLKLPSDKASWPRMLVIDDHNLSRNILIELLAELGFDVRGAENGVHGLEVLKDWSADIIWLDMTMPKMDGITFVNHLRQGENGANFHVVATTANAFGKHKKRFIEVGCDDFLRKPIETKELNATIQRYLFLKDKTALTSLDEASRKRGIEPG